MNIENETQTLPEKTNGLNNNITALEANHKIVIEEYINTIAKITKEKEEAEKEAERYKKEADKYANLNKNLIRIATERANVKRQITPKKQHSGYVFTVLEEYILHCRCLLTDSLFTVPSLYLPCVRIVLQSPYEISFDLQSARDLIYYDLENKFREKFGIANIFPNNAFTAFNEDDYEYLWERGATKEEAETKRNVSDESMQDSTKKENFIFRTQHRANFSKGFWEVEYLTRYAVNIPPDMLR